MPRHHPLRITFRITNLLEPRLPSRRNPSSSNIDAVPLHKKLFEYGFPRGMASPAQTAHLPWRTYQDPLPSMVYTAERAASKRSLKLNSRIHQIYHLVKLLL